jgi:anti-sigma B factor antagonist
LLGWGQLGFGRWRLVGIDRLDGRKEPGVIGIEAKTDFLEDGTIVLSIEGELDLATAPAFEAELLAAVGQGGPRVIVDLTKCEFLDSTTLTALIRANKQLDGSGPLALVVPHSHTLRVFEITHLEQTFTIHPSREAAINDGRQAEPDQLRQTATSGRPSEA